MIAVCIPSRGLVHSRTVEHVFKNLEVAEVPYRLFLTHNLPIPDCFNRLTRKALHLTPSHLWFVEEDMYFPADTLQKMLEANAPVATIDYPVSPDFNVVLEENGEVMRFGTGCTLVKSEVFDQIGAKWRSDVAFVLPNWDVVESKHETYGQHDIEFAQRCRQAGIRVEVVGKGNQYRLIERGKAHTNSGAHDIRTIT